jgi:hypothetical protein
MSVDMRPTLRDRRRSKKEPDRPDYSEPDFSSWAKNLDDFIPRLPVRSSRGTGGTGGARP